MICTEAPFTITSLGSVGGLLATPIINQSRGRILGLPQNRTAACCEGWGCSHSENDEPEHLSGSSNRGWLMFCRALFIQEIIRYLQQPACFFLDQL